MASLPRFSRFSRKTAEKFVGPGACQDDGPKSDNSR